MAAETEPRVVALMGYAQTGKDEAARILVEEGGFVRVAFADAVRECLLALDPWVLVGRGFRSLRDLVDQVGWDKAKGHEDVRGLLQRLGTEVVRERIDCDAWAKVGAEKARRHLIDGRSVVFTDIRFWNEANEAEHVLDDVFAEYYEVSRPNFGPVNGHASEGLIEELVIRTGAMTFHNSGTLAEWHDTVRREILGVAVK